MNAVIRCGCFMAMFLVAATQCLADPVKKATHESIMQDFLKTMNNGTDCLANIKDKATTEKATAILKQETERLKVMTKDAEALGPPSKEENKRLTMKYEKDIQTAGTKFTEQCNKLPAFLKTLNLPPETQQALGQGLISYGTEMTAFGKAMGKWEAK